MIFEIDESGFYAVSSSLENRKTKFAPASARFHYFLRP
jgi:hypothetical protein